MDVKLSFKTGRPKEPGYYMVLFNMAGDEEWLDFPTSCYWTGEQWVNREPDEPDENDVFGVVEFEEQFVAAWASIDMKALHELRTKKEKAVETK